MFRQRLQELFGWGTTKLRMEIWSGLIVRQGIELLKKLVSSLSHRNPQIRRSNFLIYFIFSLVSFPLSSPSVTNNNPLTSCPYNAIGWVEGKMAIRHNRSAWEFYYWLVFKSCIELSRFRWGFRAEETSTPLSLLSSQLQPFLKYTCTIRAHARQALFINYSVYNFKILLDFIDG